MADIILDLCGGTGSWSALYREAGYSTYVVDPLADPFGNSTLSVQEFAATNFLQRRVHGVMAAPPYTEFAGSGARWWSDKSPELLKDAIDTVRVCLHIIERTKPKWWCLENPVGRLARCVPELGKWKHTYHPWEYGGYGFNPADPLRDAYTKRTCLWGEFVMPEPRPVPLPPEAKDRHRIHHASPGPERAKLRSITPPGFARAFFETNP